MDFTRGSTRDNLCREKIFGEQSDCAEKALKCLKPAKNGHADRLPGTSIRAAYRKAVEMGLDLPTTRKCSFPKLNDDPVWSEGPLAKLHALLKSRFRFVPYAEFLVQVHLAAEALARAMKSVPQGLVGVAASKVKSNLWVFFLMLRHLETADRQAFDRLVGARMAARGSKGLAALVVVDDALYSGEQLINGLFNNDVCREKDHVTLIAVPFATTHALKSLKTLVRKTPKFRLVHEPETIMSAFDGGTTVSEYLGSVPINAWLVEDHNSTTVFEHKVADSVSLPWCFLAPIAKRMKLEFVKRPAKDDRTYLNLSTKSRRDLPSLEKERHGVREVTTTTQKPLPHVNACPAGCPT